MFQIKTKSLEYLRPLLPHGFNLAGPCPSRSSSSFGFLGQALGGYAAGRDENMGMDISYIVAALGRVYSAIGSALVSTYQPQAKRL